MEPFDPLTPPQKLADTMECSLTFSCPTQPSYPTSYPNASLYVPMSYVPQGPTAVPVTAPAQAPASGSLTTLQTMPHNDQHIDWEAIPQQAPFNSNSTATQNTQVTNSPSTEPAEPRPDNDQGDIQEGQFEDAPGNEPDSESIGDTPYVSPETFYNRQVSPIGIQEAQEPEVKTEENALKTVTRMIIQEAVMDIIQEDSEKSPIVVEDETPGETTSEGTISGGSISEPSPAERPMTEEEEDEYLESNQGEELGSSSPEFSGAESPEYSPTPTYSPPSPTPPPEPKPQSEPKDIPLEPVGTPPLDPRTISEKLKAGRPLDLVLPQFAPQQHDK